MATEIIKYEAFDGTIYNTKTECETYEKIERVKFFLEEKLPDLSKNNFLITTIIDNIRELAEAVDPDIFEE